MIVDVSWSLGEDYEQDYEELRWTKCVLVCFTWLLADLSQAEKKLLLLQAGQIQALFTQNNEFFHPGPIAF
jgi:hypothetical protein